jgi:hypothetical protein
MIIIFRIQEFLLCVQKILLDLFFLLIKKLNPISINSINAQDVNCINAPNIFGINNASKIIILKIKKRIRHIKVIHEARI